MTALLGGTPARLLRIAIWGGVIMAGMEITHEDFYLTIAGGVVLFLIAVRMLFPTPEGSMHEGVSGEPFVVPLAIPYVAGPSVLAVELLLMSREPERWADWLAAVCLAWLAGSAVVMLGSRLRKYLGQKGLTAVERLMGMVLVAVAVQMLLNGVGVFVASLRGA